MPEPRLPERQSPRPERVGSELVGNERTTHERATEDPEHADRAARPPVVLRLGSAGRGPGIAMALILAFVALAIVKPWPIAGPRPTPAYVPPRPTPSPTADPLAALRDHCQDPAGWRIYSRERWATRALRSWRSFEPARAGSGPTDPTIPIVPLGAEVDALGFCSPWGGGERPPATATIDGWRLVGATRNGTSSVAAPIPLVPLDFDWPGRLGALYGAPGVLVPPAAGMPGWPAGRYVFAIRAPSWERWWGVDVLAPTPPSKPGAPSSSAAPSAIVTTP